MRATFSCNFSANNVAMQVKIVCARITTFSRNKFSCCKSRRRFLDRFQENVARITGRIVSEVSLL